MKIFIITITLFIACISCTPGLYDPSKTGKERQIYIASGDSIINAFIWLDTKPLKLFENRNYYWYYKDKINSTQGSYFGQPLNGDYTVLDAKSKMILTKGSFVKGLKTGKWMKWYPDGKLKEIAEWENGFLNGFSKQYDSNGNVVVQFEYKEGKIKQGKTGKSISVKNDAQKEKDNQNKPEPNGVNKGDSIKPEKHFWKHLFSRDNSKKADKQEVNPK